MRPFRLIAFLVITLVLAGGWYWLHKHNMSPRVAGIPPQENADGTIDYTLVNWVADPPPYWVLRFPKKAHVIGDEEDPKPRFPAGLFTHPIGKNNNIRVFLTIPDFKFLTEKSRSADDSVVTVILPPPVYIRPYRLKDWERENINDECKLVGELAPGVFEYGGSRGGAFGFLCSNIGRHKGKPIIVRDKSGKLIGDGACIMESGKCTINLHFNEYGTASTYFHVQNISKAPKLHDAVAAMLKQITVRRDRPGLFNCGYC